MKPVGAGDCLGEDPSHLTAVQIQIVDPLDRGTPVGQCLYGGHCGHGGGACHPNRLGEGLFGGVGHRHVQPRAGRGVEGAAQPSPPPCLGACDDENGNVLVGAALGQGVGGVQRIVHLGADTVGVRAEGLADGLHEDLLSGEGDFKFGFIVPINPIMNNE